MKQQPIFFSYSQNFDSNKRQNQTLFSAIEPFMRILVVFLLISYFLLLNALSSYGDTFLTANSNANFRDFKSEYSKSIKTTVYKLEKNKLVDNNTFFNTENSDDDILINFKYFPIVAIIYFLSAIYLLIAIKPQQYLRSNLSFAGQDIYLRFGVLII